MKFPTSRCRAWARIAALVLIAAATAAAAPPDKKDKPKAEAAQSVDSGSFGIFIKGQRVATETFSIEQRSGISIIKSQLKETGATDPASQKADLELTADGTLLRYEWSQASGGSMTVVPNNDFLLAKISTAAYSKPAEQSFLMPATTAILDNNFFIHREVLVWRYLAAACKPDAGNLKCPQDAGEFGALVPQDRVSVRVRMQLIGKEKVTIRGAERELLRLNLTGESFEWALYVDAQDHFKLIRVAIPADSTEVVRD